MLVLDESHNIKRIEGGKWADTLIEIAPFAHRRVVLSGTPVPNSLLDVWSQITFLWPDKSVLGDREAFKRKLEGEDGNASKELRDTIFPLYWRIRKSDLHLPRPRFHRIKVPMGRYQQAIYDAIAVKTLAEIVKAPEDRVKLKIWRRARMIRLLQAASNPSLLTAYSTEFKIPPLDASSLSVDQVIEKYPDYETPRRMEATLELAREIVGNGEKVLIWTAFIHNIKTLQKQLEDLSPAIIYGEVPKDEDEDASYNREQIIRDFKQTNRYRILIANPSACAESISLQKACYHAIYYDRTFNAAHYMQSLDRIHRIGLGPKDIVHYYIIQSKGSIDEVIDERLDQKIENMQEVLADDFATLNLDSPEDEFSEENEFERDFGAVIANLREKYGSSSD
jgi:SNF2 family DNA or RNA helicase